MLLVTVVAIVLLQSIQPSSGNESPWSLPGYAWGNGLVSKKNNRFCRAEPIENAGLINEEDEDLLQEVDHDNIDGLISEQSGDGFPNESNQPFISTRGHRDNGLVQLTLSQDRDGQTPPQASSVSSLNVPFTRGDVVNNGQQDRFVSSQGTELQKSKLRSTGTTIVGCLVGGCVVLGADTRATDDRMVADKRCEKVHCLASNVWCCGAGTSADLDALVRQTRYTLALRNLETESIGNHDISADNEKAPQAARGVFTRPIRGVSSVCRVLRDALYQGSGSIGANLVLGGYDFDTRSAILVAIHPHGSMDVVPYSALGSGGLAAMAVLESRYHRNLSLEEGIALVKDAVKAGIDNDLGSGSQIDVVAIGPHGANYTRGAVPEEEILQLDKTATEQPVIVELDSAGEKTTGRLEGVNGFGNLAYSVQSTRVLLQSHEAEEEKRQKTWNDILGLD